MDRRGRRQHDRTTDRIGAHPTRRRSRSRVSGSGWRAHAAPPRPGIRATPSTSGVTLYRNRFSTRDFLRGFVGYFLRAKFCDFCGAIEPLAAIESSTRRCGERRMGNSRSAPNCGVNGRTESGSQVIETLRGVHLRKISGPPVRSLWSKHILNILTPASGNVGPGQDGLYGSRANLRGGQDGMFRP